MRVRSHGFSCGISPLFEELLLLRFSSFGWSPPSEELTQVLHQFSDGEFDPGSGRTLAACLRNASRAVRLSTEPPSTRKGSVFTDFFNKGSVFADFLLLGTEVGWRGG